MENSSSIAYDEADSVLHKSKLNGVGVCEHKLSDVSVIRDYSNDCYICLEEIFSDMEKSTDSIYKGKCKELVKRFIDIKGKNYDFYRGYLIGIMSMCNYLLTDENIDIKFLVGGMHINTD